MFQSKLSRVFKTFALNHKTLTTIFICIISCLFAFTVMSNSVFADDPSSADYVETTFFGNLKDDGNGCSVYTVINSIIDIMSMGIGILGVIGIIVVGIQYLTARENETQVQKSKRRIGEIVIGLVAFAVLFALTQWLLPGGRLNNNIKCETISDEDLAALKESEKESEKETEDKGDDDDDDSDSDDSDPANKVPNTAPYLVESQFNRECLKSSQYKTTGEKIVCILDKISVWADKHKIRYGNQSWRSGYNTKMNCSTYTSAAYVEAGLLKNGKQKTGNPKKGGDYFAMFGNAVQGSKMLKKRGTVVIEDVKDGIKIKTLAKQNKILPGDVIGLAKEHTYMYIGKSGDKYMCQQLGRGLTMTSTGPFHHNKSKFQCGNRSVYTIVHPKRDITISL